MPFFLKITPNVTSVIDIANAAQRGGADGVLTLDNHNHTVPQYIFPRKLQSDVLAVAENDSHSLCLSSCIFNARARPLQERLRPTPCPR